MSKTNTRNGPPTAADKPAGAGRAAASTAYAPPTQGLMAAVPAALLPYAQLIRLDKPGFIYFLIPHVLGALLAATVKSVPAEDVARALLLLLAGSVPLAFVNYAWNDSVDGEFDARVARTRHRPVARGAISQRHALVFTAALALAAAAVLARLPRACMLTAVPLCAGAFVYPLSKRWTRFPQLIFGPVIASGVFMGAAALGPAPLADLLRAAWHGSNADASWAHIFLAAGHKPLWLLFAANTAWAVCYELVYSFQDVEDDGAAGVGTMTLLIRARPKPLLGVLAVVAVGLLAWTGVSIGASAWFYGLSVAGSALVLSLKLFMVDLEDPSSCIWWFSAGGMGTGGVMALGMLANYRCSAM